MELARALERHLFEQGYLVFVAPDLEQAITAVRAGLIAIMTGGPGETMLQAGQTIAVDASTVADPREIFHLVTQEIASKDDAAQWTGGAGI
jgi:hypothetical protein